MPKGSKIVQLIPAPAGLDAVVKDTSVGRIVQRVVALALTDGGNVCPVFVQLLKNDNVGRLTVGSPDMLISESAPD